MMNIEGEGKSNDERGIQGDRDTGTQGGRQGGREEGREEGREGGREREQTCHHAVLHFSIKYQLRSTFCYSRVIFEKNQINLERRGGRGEGEGRERGGRGEGEGRERGERGEGGGGEGGREERKEQGE